MSMLRATICNVNSHKNEQLNQKYVSELLTGGLDNPVAWLIKYRAVAEYIFFFFCFLVYVFWCISVNILNSEVIELCFFYRHNVVNLKDK